MSAFGFNLAFLKSPLEPFSVPACPRGANNKDAYEANKAYDTLYGYSYEFTGTDISTKRTASDMGRFA